MNRILAAGLIVSCGAAQPGDTRAQAARVELDHVFIVVTSGGVAEIEALRAAGFTLRSEPSRHDGQGTASVAVYFQNAYLELIWVDSSVSVQAEHAKTLEWFRKASSWRTSGASPFGFGLRRLPGDTAALPVAVQRQTASWLPPGSAYELLHQPSDSLAADFFVVPASNAVPAWIESARQRFPEQLQHRAGERQITLVRQLGAAANEPSAFRALRPGMLEMARAEQPLLEVYLDHGMRRERLDLRPTLPLVIVR